MNSVKTILLFTLLFIGVGSAEAECCFEKNVNCRAELMQMSRQGRGHFDPVKFRKDLEAYITKEAGLTEDEAKKFFPVFHSSKRELRKLSKQVAVASMRIKKENLTEKQCDQILAEIEENRKRCAEIQNEASKEWRKILPASKILKVFNAEHNFGKRTFRSMVGKR